MKRFAHIGEKELLEIENSRLSQKTKYNDAYVERLMLEYCQEKTILLNEDKGQLDDLLSAFIASVRTKHGELFTTGSLSNIYHAVARIILKKFNFDIRNDPNMTKVQRMLKNMKAISKKNGKGLVQHTDVIAKDDLRIIGTMNSDSPVLLQYKVWITLQLHFAKRGCENGDKMKKSALVYNKNEKGQDYITLKDNLTKNHRECDNSASYGGVLMSTGDAHCPVKMITLYLAKLHPSNEFLWQRPLQQYRDEDPWWYCDSKVGVNTIRTFMPNISTILKLSKRYTNHSVRATSITLLGEIYEDTDVQAISGHKSSSSLAIYKKVSLQKKAKMSHTLHDTFSGGIQVEEIGNAVKNPEIAMVASELNENVGEDNALVDALHEIRQPQIALVVNETNENAVAQNIQEDVGSAKKPCLRVDGNSFSFHGNNCTININFQSSK